MAKTYAELFAEVRERVRTVSLEALKARLEAGTPTTLVDVREQHEFNAGYIPGAIHIPRGFLEIQAESLEAAARARAPLAQVSEADEAAR